MSKRNKKGQFAPKHSPAYVGLAWFASLASIVLLYLSGSAVLSDIASFRSCNSNSSGLLVANCGKQSMNPGDLILFALFVACAALVVTLFTIAWRMSSNRKVSS